VVVDLAGMRFLFVARVLWFRHGGFLVSCYLNVFGGARGHLAVLLCQFFALHHLQHGSLHLMLPASQGIGGGWHFGFSKEK
ncbi:MAG: hypothetical protein Q8R56_02380, partial [Polaromonas sp.]|nr:hypothetical protein [Polaromonas sp.]